MDSSYGSARHVAPTPDALHLHAHLRKHTRHSCSFLDVRLLQDPETQLPARIRATPTPRVVVVPLHAESLGSVASVLELLRRHEPGLPVVAYGPFPSTHPADALCLSHLHAALCGDPEPLLYHFLDYMDVPHRLRRTPGIATRGYPAESSVWLKDLKTLTVPDFEGIPWPAYNPPRERKGSQATLRLSRGHSGARGDRAYGSGGEPLRVWPMDRMAAAFTKASAEGVTDIFLEDPPGFWTEDRLHDWIRALDRARNTQPWSLQMLPVDLPASLTGDLALSGCRRVELIFPTCSDSVAQRFGIDLNLDAMSARIFQLQDSGVEVEARIWVGGPEEEKGEADRIVRILGKLGFLPYSLHPFPFHLDAPMIGDVPSDVARPTLADWLTWSRDPWSSDKPALLWGGAEAKAQIELTMQDVEKSVQRHPKRGVLRIAQFLQTFNPIRLFEGAAVDAVIRRPGKP